MGEVRASFQQKHEGATCEVEYFLEGVFVVGNNWARAGDIFVFYKGIGIRQCVSLFVGEELFEFLGAVEVLPRDKDLFFIQGAVFIVWVVVEKLFEGGVIALWATGEKSARVSITR